MAAFAPVRGKSRRKGARRKASGEELSQGAWPGGRKCQAVGETRL